eukprot:COSAG02_NODE_61881_length_267_cov_0.904762_1_plen_41_part_01
MEAPEDCRQPASKTDLLFDLSELSQLLLPHLVNQLLAVSFA